MKPRLVPIETQKPRLIPIEAKKPKLVPIQPPAPKLPLSLIGKGLKEVALAYPRHELSTLKRDVELYAKEAQPALRWMFAGMPKGLKEIEKVSKDWTGVVERAAVPGQELAKSHPELFVPINLRSSFDLLPSSVKQKYGEKIASVYEQFEKPTTTAGAVFKRGAAGIMGEALQPSTWISIFAAEKTIPIITKALVKKFPVLGKTVKIPPRLSGKIAGVKYRVKKAFGIKQPVGLQEVSTEQLINSIKAGKISSADIAEVAKYNPELKRAMVEMSRGVIAKQASKIEPIITPIPLKPPAKTPILPPKKVKQVAPKGLAKVAGEPEIIKKERITKPKEIPIEEKIVQEGRSSRITEYGEKIYQDYIDRFASIANITKKAQKLGVKIKPGENPSLRAREYLGMGRKVETMLRKATYRITPEGKGEITGEGLKPILDDIGMRGINEKDLNNYLKATRIVGDLQRPKDEWTIEQIATPKQVIESKKTLENLSPNQGFKEIADRFYGFQQRVLHLLVDSGQLSEEGYKQIIKLNPHYVPFDRILKGADVGLLTGKKRFTGARTPIKRIKGSELEIYNPLESIIKNTYKIMDVAERNVVVENLSKLQEVFPDEVTPKEIKMVPVAVVEHKAAIDADFQKKLTDFAKTLGAKYKTTGQIGRVLGMYYPSGKRITRKFATPREIISHETAHFFDDKFKLKQRFYKRLAPVKGEGLWGKKKPVTEELIGLMRRMGETTGRIAKPAERFADGFEWWLTHRDLAAKEIPSFSKEMENIIREIPELSPILNIKPTPKIDIEVMKETIFRPSQFKPKGNVLEYFENGERKYIEVTPNLYQAMTGLNEVSSSLMVKVLSKPAHWLRVGATITPEFMLRNPLRDQLTALFQTKIGFVPGIDTAGAIADVIGETEVYHQWLRSGGAYSGFVELSRPQLQKSLKELTRPLSRKLLRKLNIITTAQDLSQLFEQATRVAVFKKAIKKMTLVEAGFLSREATVDFGRKGSQLKDINQMVAFLNAGIQGVDKSIRNTIRNPAGMSIKAIAAITIPALLLYLRNRKDPDFKEIPRWQRDLFFVTKIGSIYIRIPKPFLYGQVFGSIPERFFEYLDTKDKSAFDDLSRSIYDSLLPVSGDPAGGLLATAIKPLIENTTNWNFFLERNIVSEGRKRLLPEEQYQKYTTKTARLLGKKLKYPAAKIENLIRGWFGGSGRYALEVGDMLIKGIKKARREKIEPGRPRELADIPLIKGFVTRPAYGGTSESIQNFYEYSKKANAAYLTYRKLIKEDRRAEAIQIRESHPEWKYAKIINKYSKILSAYTNIIDKTIKSSTLSIEEKRRKIKSLERKRVIVARKANEFLRKKK